jgi:hypothetical protein
MNCVNFTSIKSIYLPTCTRPNDKGRHNILGHNVSLALTETKLHTLLLSAEAAVVVVVVVVVVIVVVVLV